MNGTNQLGIVPTARNLPDRIADELTGRIVTGELSAGELLPAERSLALELRVDRSSLRMALRQLTRMKFLHAVRGSGVTVLDYRQHAGLDCLTAVLEVPGLELGGTFLMEVLAHWNTAMPTNVTRAFARATPDALSRLDALFARQLDVLDAGASSDVGPVLDEVAEIELDVHDLVVAMCGDITLRLMANSTRPFRRKLTRMQFGLVDIRAQVELQRAQAREALSKDADAEALRVAHLAYLKAHHEGLRQHLTALPPNPSRRTHWQRETSP